MNGKGEEDIEDGEWKPNRQRLMNTIDNGRRVILARFSSHRTDRMPQPRIETTRRTFFLWSLSLVAETEK